MTDGDFKMNNHELQATKLNELIENYCVLQNKYSATKHSNKKLTVHLENLRKIGYDKINKIIKLETTICNKNKEIKELKKSLEQLPTQYSELIKDMNLINAQNNDLKDETYALETMLKDLRNPLSKENLANLIKTQINTNYDKIKEELIAFNAENNQFNYVSEPKKYRLIDGLSKLGLTIKNPDVIPVSADTRLISFDASNLEKLNFDFNETEFKIEIYDTEFEFSGYMNAVFKDKKNPNNIIRVDYWLDPANSFSNFLIKDHVDFAKANLWGLTSHYLNPDSINKNYALASKLIVNNDLHDLAIPFINKNKNNTEMLVHMSSVLESYK